MRARSSTPFRQPFFADSRSSPSSGREWNATSPAAWMRRASATRPAASAAAVNSSSSSWWSMRASESARAESRRACASLTVSVGVPMGSILPRRGVVA